MSITAARFSMQFDGTRKTNRNGQRKITFTHTKNPGMTMKKAN